MTAIRKETSESHPTERDPRWQAVKSRDPSADDQFFYSVSTTGVYCYPSCAARLPRPENVDFHTSRSEAERAGFRACRRCKSDQPPPAKRHAELVTRLCRLIESSETEPTLHELANAAGLSTSRTQKLFKLVTGITPKAYAAAQRAERIRLDLTARTDNVTRAAYAAGYGSSSRFYDKSNQLLGMTPSDYRAGGAEQRIRFAVGTCSLGTILVAATERGVCAISLGSDPESMVHELETRFPSAELVGADDAFEALVARVVGLVENPQRSVDLPLDIRGTAFQQRVWQALTEIPPGQTRSYAEVAESLGSPTATRAVAGACAANTLAVAIPCHRVVRTDGSLSGYRWGVERKRTLLEREAAESRGEG